jgi:hypothetical protein
MRTQRKVRHLLIAAALGLSGQVFAQTSIIGHGGGPGYFLGWNSSANQILEVKNEGDQPIDFYTSDRFRARINERVTYSSLNTFPNIPADGFMLITPSDHFFNFNPRGPFSRLHLAEGEGDNAQAFGYRLWQRNGVTFTGNGDQGYIGQKYNREDQESDLKDMVIQWNAASSSFQRL